MHTQCVAAAAVAIGHKILVSIYHMTTSVRTTTLCSSSGTLRNASRMHSVLMPLEAGCLFIFVFFNAGERLSACARRRKACFVQAFQFYGLIE